MSMETFNTQEEANIPPAKAGTPNLPASLAALKAEMQPGVRFGVPPHGVPALAGEGMKEPEGMLK